MSSSTADLSLYVHIPFCAKKCPYCDFNSYATKTDLIPERAYTEAIIRELRHYAEHANLRGRKCASIFFGGGTPSLFSASAFDVIIQTAAELLQLDTQIEITLEANPGTVDEDLASERLRGYRAAGINRISLGAQSFSPRKLALLGRLHDGEATKRAVENVVRAGFRNFNLDLISATVGETEPELLTDLNELYALGPRHISVYLLTIEPGTEFGRRARVGEQLTALDDAQAKLYELTTDFLEQRGIYRYEISNYAYPGSECLHNIGYWSGREFVGLGAGAHGFLRTQLDKRDSESATPWGVRWSNLPGPTHYIERVSKHGHARQNLDVLDRNSAELEFFLLGLRRSEGISPRAYADTFGEQLQDKHGNSLDQLVRLGLLSRDSSRIALTKQGFLQADAIFSYFA